MTAIPDEAVQSAAEALLADNCVCDTYDTDPCACASWEREAQVALTAAAPHLRAAWAEEVRAIEVPEHNQHDQLPSDHWYAGQKTMRDEIATLLEVGGE